MKDEYKVGDIVWFEECWEDEAGNYGDECAEILAIDETGRLKLKWLLDGRNYKHEDKIRAFLESFEYTLDDIAYKN